MIDSKTEEFNTETFLDPPPRRWAVLDIETTGIHPDKDEIIDVGYLLFEDSKLIKSYQSLVRQENELSQFIQKLTGIKSSQLRKAPTWSEVSEELKELAGADIIAHNASFERAFLEDFFIRNTSYGEETRFIDSMDFLAWMYPSRASLNLEGFLQDLQITDHETHRGFEDSLDLLKVLLCAKKQMNSKPEFLTFFKGLLKRYGLDQCKNGDEEITEHFWYYFWNLNTEQDAELAETIDFEIQDSHQINNLSSSKNQNKLHWDEELSFDGPTIKDIYRNTEKLQEAFSGYNYREGQEQLSLRLGQSFKNDIHALIQAPTGTGKTLGYLLPAALFAQSASKQVLIATGTKALQNQAIDKDVPALRNLLGNKAQGLKIMRLIGSSNHFCESNFRSMLDSGEYTGLLADNSLSSRFSLIFFEIVFFWNAYFEYENKLTRESIPQVLKRKNSSFKEIESSLGVDYRSCTGFRCPFKHACSYVEGIKEARETDIIIGNHSLMFQWPKGIPRPAHIVVDEAHRLENEATKSYSLEVTENTLDHLRYQLAHLQGIGSLFYLMAHFESSPGASTEQVNDLRKYALEAAELITDHLGPMRDQIENYFKTKIKYTPTFWNEMPFEHVAQRQNAHTVSIYNHLDSIRHVLQGFEQTLLPIHSRFDLSMMEGDAETTAFMRFDSFSNSISDLLIALNTILAQESRFSHAMMFKESDGFTFQAAPIDVGKIMHDGLLETSSAVVFTSATLANASGNIGIRGIEWATGYAYLDSKKRFKSGMYLPSAFNYKDHAKVFLCDDVPSLHDASFVPHCLEKVYPIIEALHGRTLLLFSSRARFDIARELLLEKYDGKLPLFFQGMGNNVVEEFKKAAAGVLVGMETFGEGIDIPGDKLQFLFIDKIPDLSMDLVVQQRREFFEGTIGNEFTEYYLAHRARSLHQKLGRLIRRESDFGGAIVVESRIRRWKGRTVDKFLDLLQPYQVNRSSFDKASKEVVSFIESFPSTEVQVETINSSKELTIEPTTIETSPMT